MNPRYRRNKNGVVRIHEGDYTMLTTDRVAIACGHGTTATTTAAGQQVYAAAVGARVYACTPGTRSYATTDRSQAHAVGMGTQAIAMHPNAKAYSRNVGSVAIATVRGARALKADQMGTVREEFIQDIWPHSSSNIRMTIR